MGRCLQLMTRHLATYYPTWSFQSLLGVLDQARAATRLQPMGGGTEFMEKDMNDMFWEIPKEQAQQALKWAVALMPSAGQVSDVCFAVAKGGLKELDHLGRSTSKDFHNLSAHEVLRYTDFELFHNTLFVLGPLVMCQGEKGVPIGGFLSAHISEIWCLWREALYLFGDCRPQVMTAWCDDMKQPDVMKLLPVPLSQQPFLHLCGTSDFSVSQPISQNDPLNTAVLFHSGDSVLAHPQVHLVTGDSLYDSGFSPWWQPMDKMCAAFGVGDFCVRICYTEAWDGMLGGRLEVILRDTPRRYQGLVTEFFHPFRPLRAILPEILRDEKLHSQLQSPSMPRVLLSTFKDNLYIVTIAVPNEFQAVVRQGITLFLAHVYGIALKWEPGGTPVTCGEARLSCNAVGNVVLQRKGVATELYDLPPIVEWSRWVDAWSPHARPVWRSQLPSLLMKYLWYALASFSIKVNLRSVLWGIGAKSYPTLWWHQALFRFYKEHVLQRVVSWAQLISWVDESKRFHGHISSGGRGREP